MAARGEQEEGDYIDKVYQLFHTLFKIYVGEYFFYVPVGDGDAYADVFAFELDADREFRFLFGEVDFRVRFYKLGYIEGIERLGTSVVQAYLHGMVFIRTVGVELSDIGIFSLLLVEFGIVGACAGTNPVVEEHAARCVFQLYAQGICIVFLGDERIISDDFHVDPQVG